MLFGQCFLYDYPFERRISKNLSSSELKDIVLISKSDRTILPSKNSRTSPFLEQSLLPLFFLKTDQDEVLADYEGTFDEHSVG